MLTSKTLLTLVRGQLLVEPLARTSGADPQVEPLVVIVDERVRTTAQFLLSQRSADEVQTKPICWKGSSVRLEEAVSIAVSRSSFAAPLSMEL